MFGIIKVAAKPLMAVLKIDPKSAFTAAKAGALGYAGVYSGWNFFANGEGLLDSGKDLILGTKGSEKVDKIIDNTAKVVEDISDTAASVSNTVAKGAAAVDNMLSGGSSSGENPNSNGQEQDGGILNNLGNLFGGGNSIFDGVGNMVKSLFSGNLLKPVALIAGLWMMFGRSGWMSKIGGALMMLMTLGMGGQSQSQSQQQTASNDRSQSRNEQQSQDRTQSGQQTVDETQSRGNGMRM